MERRLVLILSVSLLPWILSARQKFSEQQVNLNPAFAAIAAQVGKILAGFRLAEPPQSTRGGGLSDLYRANVLNVPVVVSAGGMGSSVVVVNQEGQAFVVTNNHVVEKVFSVEGRPTVLLLFYNATLKNEGFDAERFDKCMRSDRNPDDWCQALQHSARLATVERTDPSRDLALLAVTDVPSGVTGFRAADIKMLQPGDSVAIIGHPRGLLWSLTTGIISAVRIALPVGDGLATVIQTQAPVNPGNSGGPLIGSDGSLSGVVFGQGVGESVRIGNKVLTVPDEGLNYAIGVDDVVRFLGSGHR